MRLKDTFLPPGVQARLFTALGSCPRVLPVAPAKQIEDLWARRNNCPEDEIAAIDAEMESIATKYASAGAPVSRAINAKKSRIQTAIDRRDDRE